MNLVLVDVQQEALDKAEAELKAAGAKVLARRVDVSDAAQMERLAAEVKETFGAPHFVFNNAGVGARRSGLGKHGSRLAVGAGRQCLGRDPWRAPVHAHDAGSRQGRSRL